MICIPLLGVLLYWIIGRKQKINPTLFGFNHYSFKY
ncbi:hypothetical protein [Splendidivirga corallicola]